jgi:hypothetical protein
MSSSRQPLSAAARKLRGELLDSLSKQGFRVGRDYSLLSRPRAKTTIRKFHAHFRQERLREESIFVKAWYPRIAKYLASGADVSPSLVDPNPVLVDDNEEFAALFRIASLWWSIPVSRGYGRRFRVLVFDKSNGKLFGLLGLADPVFNLRTRDGWIGWDVQTREKMLAHVMDAYVLGAVPPYNQLLGAKFISMLAASDFIRSVFKRRYQKSRSVILKRQFDGRLALVTTTSALGRSSILNRLSFGGLPIYQHLGFTEGYGHFHLANGTFKKIHKFLVADGDREIGRYGFGEGPNYRIRVVRKALEHLKLPPELLRHGIKRGVYVAPLAKNTTQFLKGEASKLQWYHRPLSEVVSAWRERWLLPRATRDESFKDFDASSWAEILRAPDED